MMARILSFVLVILAIQFLFPKGTSAQLLVIRKDGNIEWKVLAGESEILLPIPKASRIEIKDSISGTTSESRITLSKSDQKISMLVDEGIYEKELDITGWKEEVLELEERAEVQKLSIAIVEDKFAIKQKGIVALTTYPINIDPKKAELSVATDSGLRIISVLPFQAVESLLRAKLITKVDQGKINLLEKERELTYVVNGQKIINLFNIYQLTVPIGAEVSASTGEILSVDSPIWYTIIGFLFS